jgi:aminoglycoside 3-N-acetyltransferase
MPRQCSYLKQRLYYLLRRCASQERRSRLKERLSSFRKELSWAYVLLHGRFTANELIRECAKRIPPDFEILMVHTAHDGMAPMFSGAAQELIQELIDFCGPRRTLAMPAFVFGGRDYDLAKYYKTHAFDVARTASEMGLVSEVFRRKPGVKRSIHPTHSVCAYGPLAEELTATHHLGSTKMGRLSPFEVMAKRKTVILGIGREFYRSITQSKIAEDLLGDDFPVKCAKEVTMVRIKDAVGRESQYQLLLKRFPSLFHATMLRSLLSREELVEWKFHSTPLWFTTARRVTECLLEAAARGVTLYGRVEGDWGMSARVQTEKAAREVLTELRGERPAALGITLSEPEATNPLVV